ncbi:VOC family protein [Mucilaginibacter ginkgonis]|uniref:VOC family protein n=1 Tax=Mucilaginibacter ginkgonis TaxID=2682091 RepID=A0A6I4HX21_9SPHI|nr:VOC family protein [Mucilaginibacter ginkgonis]QQL51387.1 VOC family protein [Mucilaginibacter ginkgonis]
MSTRLLPTLSVRRGKEAVDFYKKAFNAFEIMMVADPEGNIVAELAIDEVHFIVADEAPDYGNYSPESLSGTTIRMGLEVDDPDGVAAQAVASGAQEVYPVADQSYGYRLGCIEDPFGHRWEIFKKLQ